MAKTGRSKTDIVEILIKSLGGRYSVELGIDLSRADSGEIFKWFLALKLFAARISSSIAERTYRAFETSGVLTPWSVREAGWDRLVKILDDGGYVRYDFSTATKLLDITGGLIGDYSGDLNVLHSMAEDGRDLERRLKGLGKGIGDVTVNVFLRELRGVWSKAEPEISPLALKACLCLGLAKEGEDALKILKGLWAAAKMRGAVFADIEAALVRLGKDFCGKGKTASCPMRPHCEKRGGESRRECWRIG